MKRTLVKSPPELWAELSDPAALARHLGDFGEIRIARVEPETSVAWEADAASGTIELKPSGWGTKVTLTVLRETPAAPEPAVETSAAPDVESDAAPEPTAATDAPEPATEASAVPEPTGETGAVPEPATEASAAPEPAVEVEPEVEIGAVRELRSRFFARLFRRRRKAPAVEPDSPQAEAAEPEPPHAEEVAQPEAPQVEPEPTPEATAPLAPAAPAPTPDLAAELAQVEHVLAERDAALLRAVLDRLGAAHHRPFSRG